VPTPGPQTVRYGGNTSCVEVRLVDGTVVILDGGTGIRELGNKLAAEDIAVPLHLLITHAHWDHILGIPFFTPIYKKDKTIVLHPMPSEVTSRMLSHDELFDGEHFPVRMHELPSRLVRPIPTPGVWQIGSARVHRVPLNHPGGSTGYRIEDADGTVLVFLTDNELVPPYARTISSIELARFARGADLLVHDSQYLEEDMPDKLGWGHSTMSQVLELGRMSEAKRLVLYHHDPERSDDALDRIGEVARTWWQEKVGAGEVIVAAEKSSIELYR
jgi:phosphoribosyl 1,2-cyclic phosphodiesterase